MKKPVRLEINNSGAWKVIGRFDACDDEAADDVLNAAEHLASALISAGARLSMRVSMAEPPHDALMRWTDAETGWRDAQGEPA
jgi:hypothetical protein